MGWGWFRIFRYTETCNLTGSIELASDHAFLFVQYVSLLDGIYQSRYVALRPEDPEANIIMLATGGRRNHQHVQCLFKVSTKFTVADFFVWHIFKDFIKPLFFHGEDLLYLSYLNTIWFRRAFGSGKAGLQEPDSPARDWHCTDAIILAVTFQRQSRCAVCNSAAHGGAIQQDHARGSIVIMVICYGFLSDSDDSVGHGGHSPTAGQGFV